jgi:arylsulfatase A-like enzyme
LPGRGGSAGTAWPDEVICEHNGHGEVILQRIVLQGRYKYVAALYDGDELYDLVADPWEMRNLVDDPAYAGVKAELRGRVVAHIERTGDRQADRLAVSLKAGF